MRRVLVVPLTLLALAAPARGEIPYERPINASHCTTIITFIGSHACQDMELKRYWWEYLEWPPNEYKCYSELVPMETFLHRFLDLGQVTRIVEPPNGYNDDVVGMQLVAPLINAAPGE